MEFTLLVDMLQILGTHKLEPFVKIYNYLLRLWNLQLTSK